MNAFLIVMLLASPLPAAETPEMRPDVAAQIDKARAMVLDFDEQKALTDLDVLVQRKDLGPAELAQAELWRGVALMSLFREAEAKTAFGISRGCNPLLESPDGVSPKIKDAFLGEPPADCPAAAPVAAADPLDAVPPPPKGSKKKSKGKSGSRPAAAATAEEKEGGLPMLGIAGIGVGAVGAGVFVVGLVGLLASVGLLVASFPVLTSAQAQDRAADARQMAMVALGMRLGGGAVGLATAIGVLAGLVGAAAGVAIAVAGFIM